MAIKPEDFMRRSMNKKIIITIKTGKSYLGRLKGYDEYDNVYLEDVEDLESGEKLGRAIFKGGNLINIQKYTKS